MASPILPWGFQAIRDQFDNPEEIDDSPLTAPSKRIERLVAGYQKPLVGTQAALAIGLGTIRTVCPHFDAWLERLGMSANTNQSMNETVRGVTMAFRPKGSPPAQLNRERP